MSRRRKKKSAGSSGEAGASVDLHGYNLADAIARVDLFLDRMLATVGPPVKVKIITGKGRHSSSASVLPGEIHRHVVARYGTRIIEIEESPADLVIGDLPVRGHFHVTLSRR